MRKSLLAACLALGLMGSTGCIYLHDRAMDFADITGAKILAGRGFKLGIGTSTLGALMSPETAFFAIAGFPPGLDGTYTGGYLGYYDMKKYGYHGRAAGIWHEQGYEFLLPMDHSIEPLYGNHFLFDSTLDYQDRDVYFLEGKAFEHVFSYPQSRFHHFGDIQMTMFLFIGLEINWSFFELFDFFAGFLSLDPSDDDTRNYKPIGKRAQ